MCVCEGGEREREGERGESRGGLQERDECQFCLYAGTCVPWTRCYECISHGPYLTAGCCVET